MGKPHKHAEVIKAFAADSSLIVQVRSERSRAWVDIGKGNYFPGFLEHMEYRIKPEKVYPVTGMTGDMLVDEYMKGEGSVRESFRTIANAAIRHAIDSGQVVLPTKEGA